MIVWNIVYILYLLCNIAILLFDSLSTLIFLPLLVILWLVGAVGAIILLVKSFRKKERTRHLTFIPLCCVCLVIILQFLPIFFYSYCVFRGFKFRKSRIFPHCIFIVVCYIMKLLFVQI